MTATKTLLEVLRGHYIKPAAGDMPGGVFVPECGVNGPGPQSRADALYVGFTSTSGRLLVGHEIKVSRSDWRKELDTAGKADFWADACHEWWIVAPGPEIVPADEIPNGWGLLYPGTRLRMKVVVKAARKPPDHRPPWDAVRSIMARVDTLQAQERRDWTAAQTERSEAEIRRRVGQQLENAATNTMTDEQRRKVTVTERLERAFGGPIETWGINPDTLDVDQVAATLRVVRSLQAATGGFHADRFSADRVRKIAYTMLDGLEEYELARGALLDLIGAKP